jgi:hypothetical protein
LDFGIVPTVWYYSIGFWNCSHSVVFFYWILELLPQCGIFLLDFGIVPTVCTIPGHFSSPQNFSAVRIVRSLVFCVVF